MSHGERLWRDSSTTFTFVYDRFWNSPFSPTPSSSVGSMYQLAFFGFRSAIRTIRWWSHAAASRLAYLRRFWLQGVVWPVAWYLSKHGFLCSYELCWADGCSFTFVQEPFVYLMVQLYLSREGIAASRAYQPLFWCFMFYWDRSIWKIDFWSDQTDTK